jgi:hypothetical protein
MLDAAASQLVQPLKAQLKSQGEQREQCLRVADCETHMISSLRLRLQLAKHM